MVAMALAAAFLALGVDGRTCDFVLLETPVDLRRAFHGGAGRDPSVGGRPTARGTLLARGQPGGGAHASRAGDEPGCRDHRDRRQLRAGAEPDAPRKVRHLPVMDAAGDLRAVVTDRDLRHQLFVPEVLELVGCAGSARCRCSTPESSFRILTETDLLRRLVGADASPEPELAIIVSYP